MSRSASSQVARSGSSQVARSASSQVARSGSSQVARSLVAMLLAASVSLGFAWQPAAAAAPNALQLPGDPAAASLFSVEQALLDLTNADRAANGLPALEFDPDTLGVARQRAASQLHTPALSHYDANGSLVFVDLLADAHVSYQLAGENLARSSSDDAGVTQRTEQALMKSPLHRKNILEESFKRVAIGAASDGLGQISFAEVYRN